eukprot:4433232-Pleurochrysis_carterae.AAC.3
MAAMHNCAHSHGSASLIIADLSDAQQMRPRSVSQSAPDKREESLLEPTYALNVICSRSRKKGVGAVFNRDHVRIVRIV